jgi:dimethylhistidine N-methyltransferase
MTQTLTTAGRQTNTTFTDDVLDGLSSTPKTLYSKYFYDDRGSRLFEQIMQLPEYYPTRTEALILETHKHTLLEMLKGDYWHLVDLGAGDAAKTRILIDCFYRGGLDFGYVPADISTYALEDLTARLHIEYVDLPVRSVAGDYQHALQWIGRRLAGRKFVLFLGSNIGNFTEPETIRFLQNIHRTLAPGDRLLVGFDLKKAGKVIHGAYNDAAGVTEAFNKNLLLRINRELGGNFDPDTFDFHANYDPVSGFVRSFLTSRIEQHVRIEAFDRSFHFRAWEAIHTENSRKFSLDDIRALATASGFAVEQNLLDPSGWFSDSIWQKLKT